MLSVCLVDVIFQLLWTYGRTFLGTTLHLTFQVSQTHVLIICYIIYGYFTKKLLCLESGENETHDNLYARPHPHNHTPTTCSYRGGSHLHICINRYISKVAIGPSLNTFSV